MMMMLQIKMLTLLLMLMVNYLAVSGFDAQRLEPSNPCFIMFSSDPADAVDDNDNDDDQGEGADADDHDASDCY